MAGVFIHGLNCPTEDPSGKRKVVLANSSNFPNPGTSCHCRLQMILIPALFGLRLPGVCPRISGAVKSLNQRAAVLALLRAAPIKCDRVAGSV
jgi:hypothetical protein